MPFKTDKKITRRSFNSTLMSILALPFIAPLILKKSAAAPSQFKDRLKEIVKDIKPVEGKVTIEMPAMATHGNLVPIHISVVSPMTNEDYIESITVMSNRTEEPVLAEFELTPACGKADISTSLRLHENQEIMALAKTNKGNFFLGRRQAQVNVDRNY